MTLLIGVMSCGDGASSKSATSGDAGEGATGTSPDAGEHAGGSGARGGSETAGGSGATGGSAASGSAGNGGSAGSGGLAAGNAGGAGGTVGSAGDGAGGSAGGGKPEFVFPDPGSAITRPLQGTLTINSVSDMTAFCASYDGVRGSVHVSGSGIVNLDQLSCLVEVTGPLELEAPNLELANLPNLVALGSLFAATPQKLVEFDMPKLRTVTDEVRITAPGLPEIEFPALQGVGDELVIASITPLLSVRLPKLVWVGAEANLVSSQLAEVDLTKLQHLGGDLRLPSSLEHLSLLEIVEVGGLSIPGGSYADIDVSGLVSPAALSLQGNELSTELVELTLPNLESATSVGVRGFPNLTRIDLPLLADVDNLTVQDNPLLESVSAPSVVECGWLQLYFPGDPELPNLESGSYIRFNLEEVGNLTLPKLAQVETDLSVFGAVVVALPELLEVNAATFGRYINAAATVATDLSLPKLTTARSLRIAEGVAALNLPVLESFTELTITSTWLDELSLDIVSAGNIDTRGNPDLVSIAFPVLESARRLSIGDTPLLESVSLPVLEEIVESLSFTEIPLLSSVALPELRDGGYLSFSLTRGPITLSAPKLETLDRLYLFYSGFTSLSLPSLTLLRDALDISNNGTLQVLSLPAAYGNAAADIVVASNPSLQTLEAPLVDWGGAVVLRDNPKLPSFDLGGMTRATSISITGNDVLASLSGLSSLDRVGDVTLYDNPLLTSNAVDAFVASITTITGDVVLAPQ